MDIVKRPKVSLQLDIAPLIDIVFLLLIFFMLTSTFMKEKALEVTLPKSESSLPAEQEAVRIEAKSADVFVINGENISKAALSDRLQQIKRDRSENVPVLVQIDNAAEVQLLVTTMDALRQAGLLNVSIATEQQAEELAP